MSVEMKDSGIAWIGEIPKHWDCISLKFLCRISTGDKDTVNKIDDGLYPFFVRSPQVERINSYTYDGEAILMAGDGVGAGRVFHYFCGKFDYHQRVYNLHNLQGVKGKLLYYYLSSNFYKLMDAGSAKSTVDSVRLPMLKDFPVVVPTTDEQSRIANFLDKKCAEIDELIALQEQMIAQLTTYKQAVITETVTKGLDLNVKMKDSGVEWIGEIPEHWKYDRLKNLFSLHRGYDLAHEEFVDRSVPVYGSGGFMGYHNKIKVIAPNIIIGRSGSVGKLHFIEEDFWAHNTGIYISENKGNNMKYIYYILSTIDMDFLATKTAVPTLDRKKIQEHYSVFTEISEEQQSIANYLDQKCKDIDELISVKKEKIEKLKAYKKSVIYEYVTGKKQVIIA